MKISIVIPAYNEGKRIGKTIINLNKNFPGSELIVVSNGSTDNTVSIVQKFKRKLSNLKIIKFSKRIGKGGSILEGFELASGDIIGFLDADDSFEIKGIKLMIKSLKKRNYECVIASKWKNTSFSDVPEPFFRKVASRIWNFLVRILFNLEFNDTQAGSKFLTRKVLKEIGMNFHCRGYETDIELIWRVSKKGYLIKETFVPSTHSENSSFKITDSIPMLFNLLKLRIKGV